MRIRPKSMLVGLLATVATFVSLPKAVAFGVDDPAERGPPNFQSNPEFARIDSERGAVLCSWMILTEIKAINQRCHDGEDPELTGAIDRSLERFHDFIVANSPQTLESLNAALSRRISESQAEPGICDGDGEEFYRHFAQGGAAGIEQWTERTLAVPRPPVLNPCL